MTTTIVIVFQTIMWLLWIYFEVRLTLRYGSWGPPVIAIIRTLLMSLVLFSTAVSLVTVLGQGYTNQPPITLGELSQCRKVTP